MDFANRCLATEGGGRTFQLSNLGPLKVLLRAGGMNFFLLIALQWVALDLAFLFVVMVLAWAHRRNDRFASRFARLSYELEPFS
jgi:hypothetical protein